MARFRLEAASAQSSGKPSSINRIADIEPSPRLKPFTGTPKLVRELFFTPATPRALVDLCFTRLQVESYLAFIDTLVMLARPRSI